MDTTTSNSAVNARRFKKPGILIDLDTGEKYQLIIGDQTVGRKDDDKDNNIKPDIAIKTNDVYMSRIHLHIIVEKQDNAFYHKIWIPKEVENVTLLNGKPLAKGEGHKPLLEKNQVICMPLAKIKIVDE